MFVDVVQAHNLAPDVSLKQLVCVMMMAGSTDFLTPIGYQVGVGLDGLVGPVLVLTRARLGRCVPAACPACSRLGVCACVRVRVLAAGLQQTNMMVRPYGNYTFMDFTKFGIPLQIGAMLIAVAATLAFIP
jgi:hypothetical protein